ncbi:MAG TPA: hypothetical protein VIP06_03570 [Nocardioides sp.]
MGYGVYEDPGRARWAGYMVPAECDFPDCKTEIERGLDWKCETHAAYECDDEGNEIENLPEGCGLFFCEAHKYDTEKHAGVKAKPDSAEWMAWQLVDDSWERWRAENPELVATMRTLVTEADLERARAEAGEEALRG